MTEMTANKPYFIRALYEWICDNELTPYLIVASDFPNVQVPMQYAEDGRIVLNVNPRAITAFSASNEEVSFSARFSGKPFSVYVPMAAVIAIYAQENGEGMFFEVDEAEPTDEPPKPQGIKGKKGDSKVPAGSGNVVSIGKNKSHLSVVK